MSAPTIRAGSHAGTIALELTGEDVLSALTSLGRDVGLEEADRMLADIDPADLNRISLAAIDASDDLDGQTDRAIEGLAEYFRAKAIAPRP